MVCRAKSPKWQENQFEIQIVEFFLNRNLLMRQFQHFLTVVEIIHIRSDIVALTLIRKII